MQPGRAGPLLRTVRSCRRSAQARAALRRRARRSVDHGAGNGRVRRRRRSGTNGRLVKRGFLLYWIAFAVIAAVVLLQVFRSQGGGEASGPAALQGRAAPSFRSQAWAAARRGSMLTADASS